MSTKKQFNTALEPLSGGLGWTVARLPFDARKIWPERNRMRVRGTINGVEIRTSLFSFSDGSGQFLLVNKKMQREAHVSLGATAEFVLEPDLDERIPAIPPELAKLLNQDRGLKKFYEGLNPSARSDIAKTIAELKSAESRIRRAEQLAERMMLALEGERDLPPILKVAFRRSPQAAAGWKAMTPVQRRRHLLGIFSYQSPEAREKRAINAVDEAVKVAEARSRSGRGKAR